MLEISIFVDESGEVGSESKYYLLTLLFHEQGASISPMIKLYEQSLRAKSLPNIPFHASPLMNGNDDYKGMDIQSRKQLFSAFYIMLQHLPVRYATLAYSKSEFVDAKMLTTRMKRDIVNLMFENLDYLQQFDKVKIYYDDGQSVVTQALHDATEYALSSEAVLYRNGSPKDYRLSQAADFICAIELTAIKYQVKEQTKTDERFFGAYGTFKKNYLKKVRKLRL